MSKNAQKMQVYIDAVGIDRDIMRAALRPSVEFLGFCGGGNISEAQPEKIDNDLIKQINTQKIYVIVHGYGNYNVLKKQGVDENLILIFYDARIKTNFSQKFQKLKQVFKIYIWAWEFLKFSLNYKLRYKLVKYDDFRRWIKIKRDIKFIKKNGLDKKIVLMGVNKFSEYYIKEIKDKIAFIIDENHIGENVNGIKVTGYYEILSLNPNNYYYYIFDKLKLRRQQGDLIELGVSDSQIFLGGRTRSGFVVGTGAQDAFDPILGYTRDESGFTIFSNSDDENVFKIATLGDSTSDPKLENIRSWSEFLFENLSEMGIKVKVYAGGLSSYTVAQQCLKLIKDVLVISPDIVLNYSGASDMAMPNTDINNHFFVRSYYSDFLKKVLRKNKPRNIIRGNAPIKRLDLGLYDPSDKAEFWIKCERIMHSVCEEFSIDFHGCLQPLLYEDLEELDQDKYEHYINLYEKCKTYIKANNSNWFHDFTGIFDENEEVFFDKCHVIEKGNRIIAQNMMPFVLESYNKKSYNNKNFS